MKIYHYTTIDTLALILKNKTIRFNRLDNGLDDLQEGNVSSRGIKLGHYGFVSCWTENKEENVPLWKMYTDNGLGVRIALEKDMFKDYYYPEIVEIGDVKFNAKESGWQHTKTPIEDMFSQKHIVYTLLPSNINSNTFYKRIEYVDDIDEELKDCLSIEKVTDQLNRITIRHESIGKYKHKRWKFEEETRFFLFIIPGMRFAMNKDINIEYNQWLYDVWTKNIPNTISDYDMHLKENIFDDMEITLSPNIPQAKKIIVEALRDKYAPKAIVKPSDLDGSVKLK